MPLTNRNATPPTVWLWSDAEISRGLLATGGAASLFCADVPRENVSLSAALHMDTMRTITGDTTDSTKRLDSAIKAVGEYLDERSNHNEGAKQCRS